MHFSPQSIFYPLFLNEDGRILKNDFSTLLYRFRRYSTLTRTVLLESQNLQSYDSLPDFLRPKFEEDRHNFADIEIVINLQIFKQNCLRQCWISSKSIMQLTKTFFSNSAIVLKKKWGGQSIGGKKSIIVGKKNVSCRIARQCLPPVGCRRPARVEWRFPLMLPPPFAGRSQAIAWASEAMQPLQTSTVHDTSDCGHVCDWLHVMRRSAPAAAAGLTGRSLWPACRTLAIRVGLVVLPRTMQVTRGLVVLPRTMLVIRNLSAQCSNYTRPLSSGRCSE